MATEWRRFCRSVEEETGFKLDRSPYIRGITVFADRDAVVLRMVTGSKKIRNIYPMDKQGETIVYNFEGQKGDQDFDRAMAISRKYAGKVHLYTFNCVTEEYKWLGKVTIDWVAKCERDGRTLCYYILSTLNGAK